MPIKAQGGADAAGDAVTVCCCGIDPGATGAFAFFFASHPDRVAVEDLPVVAGKLDAATLADRLRQMNPDFAVIERIHFMPKSGKATIASMMENYGAIKGVLAALQIPTHIVSTTVWKPHFRLPLGGGLTEKDKHEASRALALMTFPKVADRFARKADHNRSEAALLARYGAEKLIPQQVAA